MIFNFGDNPTLDVFRMLMHYAAQQKKTTEESQVYFSKVITNGEKASIHELPDSSAASTTTDGPRRLHITNLPFKIRDNELRTMFEAYGTVIDAEIIFNERGSKGFGFVTMESADAAAMAKEALNGKEMDGRKIEVNNATPRATPTKNPLRSKKSTALVKASYGELLPPTPAIPSQTLSNGWAPQAFALSSAPIPSPQLTIAPPQLAPPPPFSFSTPTPPMGLPGFHCYPTPEQYAAQYYSYIASHGALRNNVPKTNSIGNYRFQPY